MAKRPRVASDAAWQLRREAGEAADGWPDCPYCESPFAYMDGVVDHIHPHALGGSNRRENLWLCCSDCNKRKQDMRLTVWAYTQGISPERLYVALKRDGKSIPQDLLDLLNLED